MPLPPLYLEWLHEPDARVLNAKAANLRQARIFFQTSPPRALGHLNAASMLWYLSFALIIISSRVDNQHGGLLKPSDQASLAWMIGILLVWLCLTARIWSRSRKSRRSQKVVVEWRQNLTALANGFEPQPEKQATFASIITADRESVLENPRFTASGLEFGSLTTTPPGSRTWHYLAVTLPARLPRLVLDATSNNTVRSDLPSGLQHVQRISLEGDFDRAFVTYAPVENRADALYVLSPEVMSDLVAYAGDYNVEIVDDTLVFFTPTPTDFTDEQPWNAVHALIDSVVPRILRRARLFVEERLPRPHRSLLPSAFDAEATQSAARPAAKETLVTSPVRLIGRSGRRIVSPKRTISAVKLLRDAGGYTAYTVAYFVPVILIIAAAASILDARP